MVTPPLHSLSQDPADPDFARAPDKFYARARDTAPVIWWAEYGMAAACRYDAVMAALRHRSLARVPPGGFPAAPPGLTAFSRAEAWSLLNLEGDVHAKLRRTVLAAFTSRRVADLRPGIAGLCDDLVAAFPPDRPFDLIASYCEQVPLLVIARLMGLPARAGPALRDWSARMVRMYCPAPSAADQGAAEAASAEFIAFLGAALDSPAADQDPGGLIADLAGRVRNGDLARDAVLSTAILLLNAGHEATVHALGNAVVRLLATGDAVALSRPDAVDASVEECLRLDPPLHLFTRWAVAPADIGGMALAPGDQIACLLASANRDPRAFEAPNAFRPNRPAPTLASFGAGVHFCLGAPLARVELAIALDRLFAACPGLALAEPPSIAPRYHFFGHDRLMVRR